MIFFGLAFIAVAFYMVNIHKRIRAQTHTHTQTHTAARESVACTQLVHYFRVSLAFYVNLFFAFICLDRMSSISNQTFRQKLRRNGKCIIAFYSSLSIISSGFKFTIIFFLHFHLHQNTTFFYYFVELYVTQLKENTRFTKQSPTLVHKHGLTHTYTDKGFTHIHNQLVIKWQKRRSNR